MNKTNIEWVKNPDGTHFKPLEDAYITGFFDGEGSAMILTIRRRLRRGIVYRFRPVIKIQQKTKAVLIMIMHTLECGHIDRTPTGYTYIINGLEGVMKFYNRISFYSVVKLDALVAVCALARFQLKKKSKNEPYTSDDTGTMLMLRDKAFRANGITRSGLKQKYSWLQIMTETNFVTDIEAWKKNRMRGIHHE